MKTAIYPGSFDPIHNGHVDVIERAAHLCDRVIVAVARNASKKSLYTIPERIKLIEESVSHIGDSVVVDSFEGLLVDFAAETKADAVIRGLRAVSDFEFEFQMALMNRQLSPDLETLFLMPSQEHIFLSSRMVKEIASLGGEISPFVPKTVAASLAEKLSAS